VFLRRAANTRPANIRNAENTKRATKRATKNIITTVIKNAEKAARNAKAVRNENKSL